MRSVYWTFMTATLFAHSPTASSAPLEDPSPPEQTVKLSRDDMKAIVEDIVAELSTEICDDYEGVEDFLPGLDIVMDPNASPTGNALASMAPVLDANGDPVPSSSDPAHVGDPGTGKWVLTVYYNNFEGEEKLGLGATGQLRWAPVSIPCSSAEHVRAAFYPTVYHELLHRCMSHGWRYPWNDAIEECDHYLIDRIVAAFLCRVVVDLTVQVHDLPVGSEDRKRLIERIRVLCKRYHSIKDEWTLGVNGGNVALRRLVALKCLCRESTRQRWDEIAGGAASPFCDCDLGHPHVMPPRPGTGNGEFDPSFCGYVGGDPNDPNPPAGAWPPGIEIIPLCDCTVPLF